MVRCGWNEKQMQMSYYICIFIFNQHLIMHNTFFPCHSCKCMSMSNFIFFSSYHIKAFHIYTWSSSYLFQLVLMSNITSSETYSEYRWKFDLLKVYCSFFLTQKEFISSFYFLFLIINMLTHVVFGELKGKGKKYINEPSTLKIVVYQ